MECKDVDIQAHLHHTDMISWVHRHLASVCVSNNVCVFAYLHCLSALCVCAYVCVLVCVCGACCYVCVTVVKKAEILGEASVS